jgi:hypothetical protein
MTFSQSEREQMVLHLLPRPEAELVGGPSPGPPSPSASSPATAAFSSRIYSSIDHSVRR